MKTITINVSEPVYNSFKKYARTRDRTASELIREAMERYCNEVMRPRRGILDLAPISLGMVLAPIDEEDDLLQEMLDD
ncbi:MAG: hypothetical protein GY854_00500 [Deltaproteobacteria bacterium]|nr:hypothetical protein [Deltaproteobacteria bacterium]